MQRVRFLYMVRQKVRRQEFHVKGVLQMIIIIIKGSKKKKDHCQEHRDKQVQRRFGGNPQLDL